MAKKTTDINTQLDLAMSTTRIEAFSDGVFAIAITLLIIEIKVPDREMLHSHTLAYYIKQQWPKYLAYIFSFIVIGIYWANHHHFFKLFVKADHTFNLLNVFFLMAVAFLPFPTGVFGEFISDRLHRETAVSFYALGVFLPSFMWMVIWLYGSHKKRLTHPRLKPKFISKLTIIYIVSNIFYALAVVLSFFNMMASLIVIILLTLVYLLPPKKPEFIEDAA